MTRSIARPLCDNRASCISSDKSLHETRVRLPDNTYLRFNVQLPTSDSTEITVVVLKLHDYDAPSGKKYTISNYLTIVFLILAF